MEKKINKKLIATGNGYPKSATKYLTIDNENKKHITLGDITEGGYYIIDTTWIVSDLPAGVQQGKYPVCMLKGMGAIMMT